jgi:D-alanine-D-alanine ligase
VWVKVTVLTHVEPGDARDVVVDQVAGALARRHQVDVLEVYDDVTGLVSKLRELAPDLVFNLCEGWADDVFAEPGVAALLELLKVPFTGSGSAEILLTQDKGLTKKLLSFAGVLSPRFAVFNSDADIERGGSLRMPLFVKPLRGDASIGIHSEESIVHDSPSLMRRVIEIHEKHNDAALAEEYIEGRELYVSVLGNRQPEALPPIELDLSGLPEGRAAIADRDVKFDPEVAARYGIVSRIAEVSDELRARLQKAALDAYRALRVRDYGRVDLRLNRAGEIYVLEVNANAYLMQDEALSFAAEAAGYDYPSLIEKILALAMERQGIQEPKVTKRRRPRKRKPPAVA